MPEDAKEAMLAILQIVDAWGVERERQGQPYAQFAVDVTAVLGEVLSCGFGAIDDAALRGALVGMFCQRLPGAVETAHRRGVAAAGLTGGLQ